MLAKEVTERLKKNGFGNLCGLEILEAGDGCATGRFVLGPQHLNPLGSVHGGCIFTLMDSVAGVAVYTTGKTCTTLSSNVDFLKGAFGSGELIAKAWPVRVGNHVAVYDVMVTDDRERKIARASMTFYVLES